MALVPVLGLLAVVLNLVVSRFFSERQEAISSLYLVISYVNVLVGIVAFLHTGRFGTHFGQDKLDGGKYLLDGQFRG